MLRLICLLALLLVVASPLPAQPVSDPGKVTAVTVYQGQALVTREIDLADARGLTEVIVTDLPARVTPGSLYAEPIGDVEIRSVRYRVRPVAEDTREEVQELDEQIQAIQDELAAVKAREGLLKSRAGYLQKLENFTTQTASHELTSGVLDATTLKELTKTIFEGRAEIAEEKLEVVRASRELNKRLALLTAERQQLAAGSSRTMREAVVFVDAPPAGATRLRLTYLVSGATWSPSYNLRASADRDLVVVEYNASVTQKSGEDWGDVAMTLSTASPSLVATAPTLDPLAIRLGTPAPPQTARPQLALGQAVEELSRRQKSLSQSRRALAANQPADGQDRFEDLFGGQPSGERERGRLSGFGVGGGGGGFGAAYRFGDLIAETDRNLNWIGNEIQILECASPSAGINPGRRQANNAEGISVAYRLPNRTSLPSRSDQQLIRIASLPLESEFYRVARPVLTEFVYEEARAVNETEFVLLAGPAATFLGDRFVGRGAVPTVAVGEPFTVGLGIDESLRATRELVKKERRVQGGNRVVRLDYRLVVDNFGDAPAAIRVNDRLPSADYAEIKVSLIASDPEPVDGAPNQRKQGLLRWDIEAPGNGATAGRVIVDYSVQLEYDKNRTIVEASTR